MPNYKISIDCADALRTRRSRVELLSCLCVCGGGGTVTASPCLLCISISSVCLYCELSVYLVIMDFVGTYECRCRNVCVQR